MQLSFFCQFHVVVGDSLIKNSRNLFEDLIKVLLELRSQHIKHFVCMLLNLLPVNLRQIILHFLINPFYQPLQVFDFSFKLLKLPHYTLQLYVDQILYEFLLKLLHVLFCIFGLNSRMNSQPLMFNCLVDNGLGWSSLFRINNFIKLVFSKGRLQYL